MVPLAMSVQVSPSVAKRSKQGLECGGGDGKCHDCGPHGSMMNWVRPALKCLADSNRCGRVGSCIYIRLWKNARSVVPLTVTL